MAYKFKWQVDEDENLNHHPGFKGCIDALTDFATQAIIVGWRNDTGYDLISELLQDGLSVTVLEIFPYNVAQFDLTDFDLSVICGDVRSLENLATIHKNSMLIWQDGPEHLQLNEAKTLLNRFKKIFDSIVIATPNGPFPQGPLYGNMAEMHLSAWTQKDYDDLGFQSRLYVAKYPGAPAEDRTRGIIGYWTAND